MITEQYKDKVYFTKLLCTDCPNIYKDIWAQLQISVAYFCSIGLYFLV